MGRFPDVVLYELSATRRIRVNPHRWDKSELAKEWQCEPIKEWKKAKDRTLDLGKKHFPHKLRLQELRIVSLVVLLCALM